MLLHVLIDLWQTVGANPLRHEHSELGLHVRQNTLNVTHCMAGLLFFSCGLLILLLLRLLLRFLILLLSSPVFVYLCTCVFVYLCICVSCLSLPQMQEVEA